MANRKTYRRKITTPETLEKINPFNKKIVDRFLKNCSAKKSPGTVNGYRSDFNIFFSWNYLFNGNKKFIDIKKLDMQDFFDYGILELQWKSNRYARMYSSLSELSKYFEKFYSDDYPSFRNLLIYVDKLPKNNSRKKSVFSKQELDHLMACLGDIGKPQEQCLLALIMSSGARVSELVRFTTDMIDNGELVFDGLFIETGDEIKVKGRGIDGKYIKKYIIKDLFMCWYDKWSAIRKEFLKSKNQNHNYLFVKRDGTPAEVDTVRSWMKKWDNFLTSHWYPHSGRHFWTSYLSKVGLEKDLIQYLQGWSSSELVDIYNDTTAVDREWKGLSKLKNAIELEKEQHNE